MKNISKIISILFLGFSLLLLSYVIYRSEFYHSGSKSDYYLKYYIFSISLVVLGIISFFLKEEFKIKTTMVFVSVILGLYLIEIYFFIDSRQFRIWRSGIDYDFRAEIEFYIDKKNEIKNLSTITPPQNFIKKDNQIIFPLSGISNKKTILCNEHGYFPIYDSDRYGFNNPDSEWDKEEIEYLLTGDSFAHGYCVNTPNSIAGNLRKFSNGKGTITLGQIGNGPLIEYASLREYLPLIKTKRMLWLYYEGDDVLGNHFQGLKQELKNKTLLKYLEDPSFSQNLHLRQDEIDLIVKQELDKQEKSHDSGRTYENFKYSLSKFIKLFSLRRFINSTIKIFLGKTLNTVQTINPEFKKIIKQAKNFSDQNNAEFYFIYLPETARFRMRSKNIENFNDYKKVINYVSSLNIPIIDVHKEIFQKHKDPLSLYPWRSDVHYTVEGYKLVSELIKKKIDEYEGYKN
jgi:hypothetical protein